MIIMLPDLFATHEVVAVALPLGNDCCNSCPLLWAGGSPSCACRYQHRPYQERCKQPKYKSVPSLMKPTVALSEKLGLQVLLRLKAVDSYDTEVMPPPSSPPLRLCWISAFILCQHRLAVPFGRLCYRSYEIWISLFLVSLMVQPSVIPPLTGSGAKEGAHTLQTRLWWFPTHPGPSRLCAYHKTRVVLTRFRKSASSALFTVLIPVNYSATLCHLSGRWIQLNGKRANLERKALLCFLCKVRGLAERSAYQTAHLRLKARCASQSNK